MPDQGTIEDINSPEVSDGSPGHSNKKSLKRGFPSALHHQSAPQTKFYISPGSTPVVVDLLPPRYKAAYGDNVMSTIVQIPGGDFISVDLDYGTNPASPLDKRPPTLIFQEAFSHPSNTIAAGGKGPNVVTLDIGDPKTPGADRPLLNGSTDASPPFVAPSEDRVFQSSKKISEGGAHGGTGASAGIPGVSPAALGED
jgi:hypothetical protein